MATILNGLSAFLSFSSLGFFIVAAIGYADDRASIKSAAWLTVKQGGKVYFGLRSAYVDFSPYMREVISYHSDGDCEADWCDRCNLSGRSAFCLTIVALFFSAVVAASNGILIVSPNFIGQAVNTFSAFISFLLSLIAVGMFMSICYENVVVGDDSVDKEKRWGNGAILCILGMLLMGIVTLMQLVATLLTPKSQPQDD